MTDFAGSQTMKYFPSAVGCVVWIMAFVLGWSNRGASLSIQSQQTFAKLNEFWTGGRSTVRLQLPADVNVEVGDPSFVRANSGDLRQVGEVQSILQGSEIT